MMDALHQLARTARTASLESANELLAKHGLAVEPAFLTALEAVLEVLPVGTIWSGFELPDAAKGPAPTSMPWKTCAAWLSPRKSMHRRNSPCGRTTRIRRPPDRFNQGSDAHAARYACGCRTPGL
jgi:hypothetical protein